MNLTAPQIQKYAKYTIPQLRKKAGIAFRKYIRERDKGQQCISCPSWNLSDASHFFSAGHYPELEFNEDNVHASCGSCNRFKGGNIHEYRYGLIRKIGIHRFEVLEEIVAAFKQRTFKHDRYFLIETIEKYR